MKFNQTVKEFLAEDEDVTLLSFSWSLMWRLMIVWIGIVFFFSILKGIYLG